MRRSLNLEASAAGQQWQNLGPACHLRVRGFETLPLFASGHELARSFERCGERWSTPERSVEERIAEVSPCRAVFAAERGPVGSGSRDHERARVSERGHEDARVARRDNDDAVPRPARIEHMPQIGWGNTKGLHL